MQLFTGWTTQLPATAILSLAIFSFVEAAIAQPPAAEPPGRAPRDVRGSFGPRVPSLSRELRSEEFAKKMGITDDQKQKFNDLEMKRREYFRSTATGATAAATIRSPEFAEKMREFDDKAVEVLTPEQKAIWQDRVAEIEKEGNAFSPPPPNRDRERIQALENEVKALKAEIEKIKAALPPSK